MSILNFTQYQKAVNEAKAVKEGTGQGEQTLAFTYYQKRDLKTAAKKVDDLLKKNIADEETREEIVRLMIDMVNEYVKMRMDFLDESKAPDWKVGQSYQDGVAKKVQKLGKDKVKVTFDSGESYVYQIDRYNPENWVQVDEASVNEAYGGDLVNYVKKAADKCFTGGGNGENLLQYGAEELAGHLDAYMKGPRNEDWIYTDKTATAFTKFIDTMVEEEIKNNQADV
jgi:hypothetical protein